MLLLPGDGEDRGLAHAAPSASYLACAEFDARRVVSQFIEANGLAPMRLDFPRTRGLPSVGHGSVIDDGFGLYLDVTRCAKVFLDRCREPSNLSWDRTGWKYDHTPVGVAAHELGHHVSLCVRGMMYPSRSTQYAVWRECVEGESPTSSYGCTRTEEDIAESVMLFVTNPELLQLGWPRRYWMLTNAYGLCPVETRSWREVLASPKYEGLVQL